MLTSLVRDLIQPFLCELAFPCKSVSVMYFYQRPLLVRKGLAHGSSEFSYGHSDPGRVYLRPP